jgi:hypothetical protein
MIMPLTHDKGISRLSPFPDSITKGEWYLGVICTSCGKPIYLLTDPAKGTVNRPLIGRGQISTFCSTCDADDLLYGTEALIPLQAASDMPGRRPIRRKPSNRPRQPLRSGYRSAHPTFGPSSLEMRPECAAIVARCISTWSYIEIALALLLSQFLRIETKQALAVFLAIQNSRIQFEVLQAAASVVLNEQDLELFHALMNIRAALEKERNSLVHGAFGISQKIKDGVLWTDQHDQTEHTATVFASGHTDMRREEIRDVVFVYEAADLETVAQNFEWLHLHIDFFRGYLTIDEPVSRAERYRQLCAEPRLAKEISQLRAGQKRTRPARRR